MDITRGEILSNKKELEIFPCIYFLIKNEQIVYVGQAMNVHMRVGQHCKSKDFDSFSYIGCDKEKLNDTEAHYIMKFKPPYNKSVPSNSKYKTLEFMKEVFKVGKWKLNNIVRENSLKPIFLDHYDVAVFEKLI